VAREEFYTRNAGGGAEWSEKINGGHRSSVAGLQLSEISLFQLIQGPDLSEVVEQALVMILKCCTDPCVEKFSSVLETYVCR
jgi:hypothetical protein